MSAEAAITSNQYISHHLEHLNLSYLMTGNAEAPKSFWDLHVDTIIISLVLGLVFIIPFLIIARKATSGVPGKFQNFIEIIVDFINNQVKAVFHKKSSLIAPFALTLFIWIFLFNNVGLLPVDIVYGIGHLFGASPTFRIVPSADVNTTVALALATFVLIFFYGFRYRGLKFGASFLTHPFGPWAFPVNLFFSLVEYLAKPISLALRLFGNIYGGEIIFILIATTVAFVSPIIGVAWGLFHLLINLIQAFIFMVMSITYISLASEEH